MNKPEMRLHCLSSSVKFVLEQCNVFIDEAEITTSPLSFRMRKEDEVDTMMNEAIWDWMDQNTEYIKYKNELINLNGI